jgi:NitT/TauT family transport system permease protein
MQAAEASGARGVERLDAADDIDEILDEANRRLATEIAGLDALDTDDRAQRSHLAALWSSAWPKVTAVVVAIAIWQLVVASQWRPEYVLPSPFTVFERLGRDMGDASLWHAIGTTMRRAITGFGLAVLLGSAVGVVVASRRVVRIAIGSLITGLQAMPSVAWFPLALVLFQRSEKAILFVVLLGAAPSIANGFIAGVDGIPPLLLRAGQVLGAQGFARLRYVVIPAALPSFLGGLKQGWAFAWRSLLAGELLVIIANRPSIGSRLDAERQFVDYPGLMAVMLVILVIGVLVDSVVFSSAERWVRRRRGG